MVLVCAAWSASAGTSFAAPRLPPGSLIPVACITAIAFVLAFATQESPYAYGPLILMGAAGCGVLLRQLVTEGDSDSWNRALLLAAFSLLVLAMVAAALRAIQRWIPSARPHHSDSRWILRIVWGLTVLYAAGWAMQATLELPLVVQASLAAFGLSLFLALGVLLLAELDQLDRGSALHPAFGLYLTGVNLAILLFWILSHATLAGVRA